MNFNAHITRNPGICGGEATIKGTRVTLRTILASLADGDTPEELLAAFPTLTQMDLALTIAVTSMTQSCITLRSDEE